MLNWYMGTNQKSTFLRRFLVCEAYCEADGFKKNHTCTDDSAMLKNDMSTIQGLTRKVISQRVLLYLFNNKNHSPWKIKGETI